MTRIVYVVTLVVLAGLTLANAQCIECNKCQGSNSCLSTCKPSCAPTVSVEACKGYGTQAGKESAQFACDLAKQYCGNLIEPRRVPPPKVTLQQCGNAAYGTCQAYGMDASKSPCGNMFNGAAKCSKNEFMKFYGPIIDEQCNQKAAVFDKPQGRKFLF